MKTRRRRVNGVNGANNGREKSPEGVSSFPDFKVRVADDLVILEISKPISGPVPFTGEAAIALGTLLVSCGGVAQAIGAKQVQVVSNVTPYTSS